MPLTTIQHLIVFETYVMKINQVTNMFLKCFFNVISIIEHILAFHVQMYQK
jgi:hypothetical protein